MAVSSSFNYPFVVDIKKEFQSNILRHTFTQCCEHSQSFISHLSLCGCFVYDFSYYYGRHHHHRRRRCCLLSSLLTLVSSLCACICRWNSLAVSHYTRQTAYIDGSVWIFIYFIPLFGVVSMDRTTVRWLFEISFILYLDFDAHTSHTRI